MPKIKLRYFDSPGGRGEDCRLALHIAGVDFHDDRVAFASWRNVKPSTPFGALPVLEVEGEGLLSQSNAILGFIGSRYGLLPQDEFKAAQHRALLNATEELRARLNCTMTIKGAEKKKEARQKLAADYIRPWAKNIEQQIVGPFVAGNDLSVADLKIYMVLVWFKKGTLDHIPTDFFDGFSKLTSLFEAVTAHPKVVQWYQS